MNNAKKDLYDFVETLRKKLHINQEHHPLNTVDLCTNVERFSLVMHSFNTVGFGGSAFIGKKIDTIILNENRTKKEQNFDCGHELIHCIKHRDYETKFFNCFDGKQNDFLEWEANEGSAELLVPYRSLLPIIKREYPSFTTWENINCFLESASDSFYVTENILKLRLTNLRYEIYQYLNGTSLDNLSFLSNTQLKNNNINVESINDLSDRLLIKEWDEDFFNS